VRLFLHPLVVILLAMSGTRLRAPELPGRSDTVQVHLLADAFHTGLVFDLGWLEDSGYRKPMEIGDHRFVAMSWGDETAYVQERWLTPLQVYRALFTRTPSVMECIPFDWRVEKVCPNQRVFAAEIPRSSGRALAAFLNAHAARDRDGNPVTIAPSSWGDGRLIRCPDNYRYYFPRICNVWTAQSLQACGYSIKTGSALSASGLVRQATSPQNGFVKIWDPETDELPVAKAR
jgi:hypothetical protein